jgi:phosphoserine phosphatase RsbU/P
VFPSVPDLDRRSLMSAPLLDGERLIGLVVVEAASGEGDFTRLELVVLEGIAALFSLALQRMRAKATTQAQGRLRHDLSAASRVQRGFMSHSLPDEAGVIARAEYVPALTVGGDFYGLHYDGEGKVGGVIGDVSGCGVSAALVMSRCAFESERAMRAGKPPAAVLRSVEEVLQDAESETFVTMACIQLDTATRRVRIANAGHLPLVVRRSNGQTYTAGGASGTPLGMVPSDHEEEELVLDGHEILVLMTDGLLDALDPSGGDLSMQRLLRLIQDVPHDPDRVTERIRAAVQAAKTNAFLDDVTWVALQLAA